MKLTEIDVLQAVPGSGLTVTQLRVWVSAGWVAPAQSEAGALYDDEDLARIRLLCSLRQELEIDEETLPVVLSLLDQLYGVRHELRALAKAVEAQPQHVRQAIAKAYQSLRGEE